MIVDSQSKMVVVVALVKKKERGIEKDSRRVIEPIYL
jgi:hypothetical protein